MPLPIIIKLERHWDAESTQTLIKSLASLRKQGYDQLCMESASDISEEEIISGVKSTIDFIETRRSEAQTLLQGRNIQIPDLSQLIFSNLQILLLQYVTTRFSTEMALWFKELPGHLKKLQLIETAKQLNMNVHGVDLPEEKLKELNSLEAQINQDRKIKAIDRVDDERIDAFKTNLLKRHKEGKGIIFTVGQFHFEKLVTAFKKEGCLSDVIFIHPYSPKNLDKAKDSELTQIADQEVKEELTLIEREINGEQDMQELGVLLNKEINARKVKAHPFLIKHWTLPSALTENTPTFFAERKAPLNAQSSSQLPELSDSSFKP